MKKQIIEFLKNDGFKLNIHSDAWDKDNTRVYFNDIDVCIVRFNNPKSQLIEWKNTIDGNMPIEALTSIIFTMTRV